MDNKLRQTGNLLDHLDSDLPLSDAEEETTEQIFENLIQKMALLKRSLARKKCKTLKNPDAFEEAINDRPDQPELKPLVKPEPQKDASPVQVSLPKSATTPAKENGSFNAELDNTLSTIKTGITISQKDFAAEELPENQRDKSFSTDVSIVNMIGRLSLSDERPGSRRPKTRTRKSHRKDKKPSELAAYLHKLKTFLDEAWVLVKRRNFRLNERQVTFFLEFFVVNHNYKEEIDVVFEFFMRLVSVGER